MNTRLQQFLSAENITQAQLADTLNVARAGISHILAGRNKPGYEFIAALMKHYPNLNMEWLMLGKGKMYKNDNSLFDTPFTEPSAETPVAPAPQIADEDLPEDDTLSLEDEIPVPLTAADTDTPSLTDINTLGKAVQGAVHQRKVSKIIVLFNDGTFQEM